jgi:hypothetical protein
VRDDEGQLKVAGYGSLNLTKVSEDKLQMAQPVTQLDSTLHLFTFIFAFAKKNWIFLWTKLSPSRKN